MSWGWKHAADVHLAELADQTEGFNGSELENMANEAALLAVRRASRGDGGSPVAYATVAGLRTTQLSINGEMVTITNKDSGGWRALLPGAGVTWSV